MNKRQHFAGSPHIVDPLLPLFHHLRANSLLSTALSIVVRRPKIPSKRRERKKNFKMVDLAKVGKTLRDTYEAGTREKRTRMNSRRSVSADDWMRNQRARLYLLGR